MCRGRRGNTKLGGGMKGVALSTRMLIKRLAGLAAADSGAELFEFAVVVPLLLMLLMGIVWMGRAYNVYQTMTRAAREGVRYSVLPSSVAAGGAYADTLSSSCTSGTNAFTDHVAPALKADSLDPTKVLNYCQKADWLENTYPKQCGVVISFEYPVPLNIPFTKLNTTTLDIKASAQMRLEDPPIDPTTGATKCP